MIEILLIIFVLVCCVLTYAVINLLKKNEQLETIVEYQQTYMDHIDKSIRISEDKLKELDSKGFFKSDDELGWFFKNLLYIQQVLNEFKLLNYDEIKEKEAGKNTGPNKPGVN